MKPRPPRSTRTAHSFPTRRSSDLGERDLERCQDLCRRSAVARLSRRRADLSAQGLRTHKRWKPCDNITASPSPSLLPASGLPRSEEHTSELQSLMRISYAVFCLKKKRQTQRCKVRGST